MLVFFLANRDLFTHSESIFLYWIKLGVLLKLEEMFGTYIVNVQELWITGRVVSVPSKLAPDADSNPNRGFILNTK